MRKLLLGAAAALAAFAIPARPAEAQSRASAVTVHVASDRGHWRGDRRQWRGDRGRWQGDRRWRGGDDWGWRGDPHWRGRYDWRWRSHPPVGWDGGWGVMWRNPCRSYWWDSWSWRCRW